MVQKYVNKRSLIMKRFNCTFVFSLMKIIENAHQLNAHQINITILLLVDNQFD